jgi:hypothetical protein
MLPVAAVAAAPHRAVRWGRQLSGKIIIAIIGNNKANFSSIEPPEKVGTAE